jgi:hypothetical protein
MGGAGGGVVGFGGGGPGKRRRATGLQLAGSCWWVHCSLPGALSLFCLDAVHAKVWGCQGCVYGPCVYGPCVFVIVIVFVFVWVRLGSVMPPCPPPVCPLFPVMFQSGGQQRRIGIRSSG